MTLQAPFYSIEEAATLLGVSKKTIYRRVSEGSLKAKKVGRSYVITRENLTSFVEST